MNYDFKTVVNRSKCGASKWCMMQDAVPDVPEGIVPFSVADMELKNAPEIMAGLREFLQDDQTILGYTTMTPDFLSAMVGWEKRIHDWSVCPEWAALSPGVVPALNTSIRCFTEVGDGVILFTPVYYPFYDVIKKNGRTVVDIPLIDNNHHYEIDWQAFEAAASKPENKVLLFCSPHNPVGRVWTREELEKLSEICLNNHILVLCDEVHQDLLMPEHTHTVYASLSEKTAQNSVTYIAPSKTFNLAGLQTAFAIIPNNELHKRFTQEMEFVCMRTLNIIGFKACEIAYTRCDEWYYALLQHINHNRQVVEEYMAAHIPEIIVYPMEGTYLQWWDCRGLDMTPKELEHFMQHEAFVFMDEGYIFGKMGEGFERINLACPTDVLVDALKRISMAIEERKK